MDTNSPLKNLIDQAPLSYERFLVLGMIQSQTFFRTVRAYLCPRDQKSGLHRHDFVTKRFNHLFPILAAYWGIWENLVAPSGVPKKVLADMVIDAANQGRIPMDVAQELTQDIEIDFFVTPLGEEFLRAIQGDAFAYWLDLRIAQTAIDQIYQRSRAMTVTLDNLDQHMVKMKQGRANVQSRAVQGNGLLRSKMLFRPRIKAVSMPRLMQVLGGGFAQRETTMIAGTNGGGKTVMACQLTRDFIIQGYKVAYVTTEQIPMDLTARIVSNHMNVRFEHFTQRPEIMAAIKDTSQTYEIAALPEFLWTDPTYSQQMLTFEQQFANVVFIDWSKGQGLSAQANFIPEMEKLQASGFEPDAIIFDWIGGGLDQARRRDVDLRHLYQETADFLIDYGKTKEKIMILMAQFDKVKATNNIRPRMADLSECKTMSNNVTNFIGITSLLEKGDTTEQVFRIKQHLFAEKTRNGEGGLIPFQRDYHVQRLAELKNAVSS